MVLATDEVFTYAIFNYLEINWSSHTEAGGDTTTGEGGVPAYVSTWIVEITVTVRHFFDQDKQIYIIFLKEIPDTYSK